MFSSASALCSDTFTTGCPRLRQTKAVREPKVGGFVERAIRIGIAEVMMTGPKSQMDVLGVDVDVDVDVGDSFAETDCTKRSLASLASTKVHIGVYEARQPCNQTTQSDPYLVYERYGCLSRLTLTSVSKAGSREANLGCGFN